MTYQHKPRVGIKAGWRKIGNRKIYARSAWEANYARYLEWLVQIGEIMAWEHEPKTFWFEAVRRGTRSYLPDFRVTERNGKQIYHEVKGWMDPKSATKLRRMKKYHPETKVILIGKDAYASIKSSVARMIPGWE